MWTALCKLLAPLHLLCLSSCLWLTYTSVVTEPQDTDFESQTEIHWWHSWRVNCVVCLKLFVLKRRRQTSVYRYFFSAVCKMCWLYMKTLLRWYLMWHQRGNFSLCRDVCALTSIYMHSFERTMGKMPLCVFVCVARWILLAPYHRSIACSNAWFYYYPY